MIFDRSSRTLIRGTPVGGPEPVLFAVSGLPEGCSMSKATRVVASALTGLAGWKSWSWKVRAAPIVGALTPLPPDDEPQPATARARAQQAILVGCTRETVAKTSRSVGKDHVP